MPEKQSLTCSSCGEQGAMVNEDDSEWQRALASKRDLDRLERALGNPHPIFLYTDDLPPPPCRNPNCEKCREASR